MSMQVSVIDKYPIVHYIFNKLNSSKSLENILKDFDKFPDFSRIDYDSCDSKLFNFLDNINENLFEDVDQNIIKIRNNNLFFEELNKEQKNNIINNIILYINTIVKFIKLCCLFTNKKTKDELVRLIISRIKNSIPNSIKDSVKFSLQNKESNMKLKKLNNLVKKANYYDMIGDYKKADKIDNYIAKYAGVNKESIDDLVINKKVNINSGTKDIGNPLMTNKMQLYKPEDFQNPKLYTEYLKLMKPALHGMKPFQVVYTEEEKKKLQEIK